MDKIIFYLNRESYIEAKKVNRNWFQYSLFSPLIDFSFGCESPKHIYNSLEKYLTIFYDSTLDVYEGLVMFSEPHGALYGKRINSSELILAFQNKDCIFIWETKINIEVIENWVITHKIAFAT